MHTLVYKRIKHPLELVGVAAVEVGGDGDDDVAAGEHLALRQRPLRRDNHPHQLVQLERCECRRKLTGACGLGDGSLQGADRIAGVGQLLAPAG